MQPSLAVLALLCGLAAPAAHAQQNALPTCTGLVPELQRSAALLRTGLAIQSVDKIVEDLSSTAQSRACTGVVHYPDTERHFTFTARWANAKQTALTVEAHESVAYEIVARAQSVRVRLHPKGMDGTFLVRNYVPYCTDAEFLRIANAELRLGISFRGAFYREPAYTIFKMTANGYGSGILANCIATMGDSEQQGAIFLGTDWVAGQADRRFQLYILDTGPDGFKIKNRLWETGTE